MWISLITKSKLGLDLAVSQNSWIKISIFLGTWVMMWLPIVIPMARWLRWNPLRAPIKEEQKLPLIISLYILAPFIVWQAAQLQEESVANYGIAFNCKLFLSVLLGIILGITTLGSIFVAQSGLGWIQWHSENYSKFWSGVIPLLALALGIGGVEELIFRGLFLNILEQDYPRAIAAVISSGIFALLHLVWERHNTIPQIPGLGLMGMVLVMARWADGGSLGLAWGLHSGWVWAIASLNTAALISYTGKASPWLTGLRGQPLAGAAGIICMIITALVLWGFIPK